MKAATLKSALKQSNGVNQAKVFRNSQVGSTNILLVMAMARCIVASSHVFLRLRLLKHCLHVQKTSKDTPREAVKETVKTSSVALKVQSPHCLSNSAANSRSVLVVL